MVKMCYDGFIDHLQICHFWISKKSEIKSQYCAWLPV